MGRIIRQKSEKDVVTMARTRVKNIFSHGQPVFLSFSGGKDSICVGQVVLDLLHEGAFDPAQLIVVFIDEEAIFPDVERITLLWRQKFLDAGAQFWWLCMEFKHFNCFNLLSNDETFVCWDRLKKDVWVRPMPDIALTAHPLFRPAKDSYQDFMDKLTKDCQNIVGVRVAESVQRLISLTRSLNSGKEAGHLSKPIYDWTENDVWLFIRERGLDFPIEYLYLWQIGSSRKDLRISQFFSVDTAKVLVQLQEYYPDLMDRVCAREPNAYIAALYWNTEMFRRSGKKAGDQKEEDDTDYKKKFVELVSDIPGNFPGKNARFVAGRYKNQLFRFAHKATDRDWKQAYESLVAGDPKLRTLRAMITQLAAGGNTK